MTDTRHKAPTIWIYGGVHYDPGSRQRFLEELAQQKTAPHFVAVEWKQSVFERFAAWRPCIEKGLRTQWDFLTPEDCHELSCAFAWEGDAYAERFPDSEVLWLEEARSQSLGSDKAAKAQAESELKQFSRFPTLQERETNTMPPPEPKSKQEIIDRLWRTKWAGVTRDDTNFERDAQWANAMCERSAGLHGGWIAVVVGWHHGDPAAGNARLRGLLLSKGFTVHSVRLGPSPTQAPPRI